MTHETYMRQCLVLAEEAKTWGDVPVGAVVVRSGKVIGRGANCRTRDLDPSGHAEIVAMRDAARTLGDWRLTDCTLYVTLEPCMMCAGAMVQARVAMCVYGCPDSRAGCGGSLLDLGALEDAAHQVTMMSGVLQDECALALQVFFRDVRNKQ